MGYKFKCDKNTFYGLNIHPPVRISKNISGQMILSRPSWPVFLVDFAQNPPLECTLFFFYKNLFYKNVEAEIDPNFKNVLRTFLRLRVD